MSSFTLNFNDLGGATANFNHAPDAQFNFTDTMILDLSKALVDMFGLSFVRPEIAFDSFTQELVLSNVRLGLRFNILNLGTRLNDYTLGFYIIIASDPAMLNIIDSRLVEATQEGITEPHYFDVYPNMTYYVATMYNGVFFDITQIQTLAAKAFQLTIQHNAQGDVVPVYVSRNGNQILYLPNGVRTITMIDSFIQSELETYTFTVPAYMNYRRYVSLTAYYDGGSTQLLRYANVGTGLYTTSLASVLDNVSSFLTLDVLIELY